MEASQEGLDSKALARRLLGRRRVDRLLYDQGQEGLEALKVLKAMW